MEESNPRDGNKGYERLAEATSARLDQLGTDLRAVEQSARSLIHDYPLLALGAALAGGYMLARLLPRA